MVEHCSCKADVVGSIPTPGSVKPQHLSVFERPQTSSDDPREALGPLPSLDRLGKRLDLSTLRLALSDRGRYAWVALRPPDGICLITGDVPTRSRGSCGAPLSVLEERGVVCLQRVSSGYGGYVAGVVGDEVVAVFVGGQPAALANNVFLGDSISVDEPIVLLTETETREISLVPPPRRE